MALLKVELTNVEADILCKFCSRLYFDIFVDLAEETEEAYEMRDIVYLIWEKIRG